MKKAIIWILVLAVIGYGIYYFTRKSSTDTYTGTGENSGTTVNDSNGGAAAIGAVTTPTNKESEVIGTSAGGREITAYHYYSATPSATDKEVLLVAGIHGGYEWNTALLGYQLNDYLKANPTTIPAGVKVTLIPVLNPDGLAKVVSKTGTFTAADVNPSQTVQVSGRYNGNTVDLNRNFDCDWQAKAKWQNTTVSGGTAAFSEPEAVAIRDYITNHPIAGAVVWYSSAGGVFASNCHDGVLPDTTTLTNVFAKASGYPANESFDFYAITGDMVNWMAKQQIPAISILLTNHTDTEWDKNLAGVKATLAHFAK